MEKIQIKQSLQLLLILHFNILNEISFMYMTKVDWNTNGLFNFSVELCRNWKFSDTLKIKKICKRPCILILDSLKASSVQNTVQVLREYLEAEWEAKRKTCREFSKSTMVDFCPRVPKQNNNSDCGIYLLQYVETFFQNPIVNFELPVHLEQWFPPHLVRRKREQIRDLILQLHFQQQSGSKS